MFVAVIRNFNGRLFKTSRACGMGAAPELTSLRNLQTYLQPWPAAHGRFLAFGPRRPLQPQHDVVLRNHFHTSPQCMAEGGAAVSGKLCDDAAPYASALADAGSKPRRKVTIPALHKKVKTGNKISMVTAYDTPSALLADQAGFDLILVGDSVGMVMLGYSSTVPVTMDQMVHHCAAVSRGVSGALVIGDMPFGSYNTEAEALTNATRLLKEGGADAIKLEGGKRVAHIARALTDAGIAVLGHIGLTPQSHVQLGGFRCQGKAAKAADRIVDDALALQESGCFGMVAECVPHELSVRLVESVRVPVIGIGSGPATHGQVLVWHDIMGLSPHTPKFAKRFANVRAAMVEALAEYKSELESGAFPAPAHTVFVDKQQPSQQPAVSPKPAQQPAAKPSPRPVRPVGPLPPTALPGLPLVPAYPGFPLPHLPAAMSFTSPLLAPVSSARPVAPSAQQERQEEDAEGAAVAGVQEKELRVVVVGGGSLGSLVAARMSEVVRQVDVVTSWTAHARHINLHGLSVGETDGTVTLHPRVRAVSQEEAALAQADLAVVCVKANHTESAALTARALLRPGGVVLSLQNGWNVDALAKVFDRSRVVVGTTSHGAAVQAPGRVNHNGLGTTAVGALHPAASPEAAAVARLLSHAGFLATVAPDWGELVWRKLLVNAAINPLTAILGVRNGALASLPVASVIRGVVDEVEHVYRASCPAPRPETPLVPSPRRALGGVDSVMEVVRATAANVSSMLQDVQRSQPTEAPAILGHVVREGERVGVPTPVCSALLALVESKVAQAQQPQQPQVDEQRRELKVVRSLAELRAWRGEARAGGLSVGFVPTMGCLHEGHLSLVRHAKARADRVVVSVFVNPSQFAAHEDLGSYPRTLERDVAMLRDLGVDAVFVPSTEDMYPSGGSSSSLATGVAVDPVGFEHNTREGVQRPHFFRGVATVCTKLFCAVQPDSVFFGQKDFVQTVVIKRLVKELLMPIEVVVCDTARDDDGLALSSRNSYLSSAQRQRAPVVFQALVAAKASIVELRRACVLDAPAHGQGHDHHRLAAVKDAAVRVLTAPGSGVRTVEYVSVADCESAQELVTDAQLRGEVCVSVAVVMDAREGEKAVRLIDNVVV